MAHVSGNPAWTDTTATPLEMGPLENIENAIDSASLVTKTLFPPSYHGMQAWAFDPLLAGNQVGGSGSLLQVKVVVAAAGTCTGIVVDVTTVGATLTSGQNKVCLWDPTDAQVGISADQSSSWITTGVKIIPFAGGAVTVNPGIYTVGILSNGATGASFMGNIGGGGSLLTVGRTVSSARFTFLSGQTTLPSTRPAPTSFVSPIWAGLY